MLQECKLAWLLLYGYFAVCFLVFQRVVSANSFIRQARVHIGAVVGAIVGGVAGGVGGHALGTAAYDANYGPDAPW